MQISILLIHALKYDLCLCGNDVLLY
jgi:hypothetical protein